MKALEELGQLEFKIWSLIRRTHKELTSKRELLATQESAKKILELVLDYQECDSATANTKPEQSIDQEQIISEIEDIALDMANSVPNQNLKYSRKDSYEFEHFQQELKDCFAMHFKLDSKPVNNSDDKIHSDKELMSKIEAMVIITICGLIDDGFKHPRHLLSNERFVDFKQELRNQFQTHRNNVSKPVNVKDDNLVDEDELRSKIESIIYQSDYFDWSVTEPDVKRLLELFKTYQNSNPRPVNSSDEQSIVK